MRLPYFILGSVALAGCALNHAPDPAAAPTDAASNAGAGAVVYVHGAPPSDKPAGNPASTPTSNPLTSPVVIPAGAPSGSDSAPVTRNEVARRAIEVFGDSLVLLPPPVLDSSAAEGPSWDMDVRSYETQERVAHYVSQFSGPSKEHIAARLEAGTRYEPMIRAKMRAGGLPEDMYYLALIESGFDNNAYSRAAAVGMWQFMTSTARGMGMRVDWWVDERRDPVKATTAAVRFIRGMRDQFGSLYLAAAAYNGGPGRVARGLARYADDLENTQGEDAFFVLAEKDYLRNETREYVPQLIAAALIAKEPKRYGMTVRTRPAFAYDSVRVPAATPLAAIATAAGASVADVRELNPHLLRGMTPPRVSFLVRIPVGGASGFDSSFAALPKADRVATKVVESKKGDTVDRLAEKNRISSASLLTFNPHLRRLKPSGKLVPGQAILIPSHAVAVAALNVPDPAIEKYPRSAGHLRVHTVARGESVGLIARKYHTSPERIMKLNGLKKAMIFPGQTLVVSGTASKAHRRRQGR
ncbi:MAG TPA: transglycosylase SLT domain-containing protein [Gemmatimonadaceae bacterium]